MLDLRLAVEPSAFGSSPIKVPCLNPAHHDPNPSMCVYPDHLHCYGCGFHRNDWDESLALLLGVTKAQAREAADRYEDTGRTVARGRTDDKELPPLLLGRAGLYHRFLRERYPNKARWFYDRGLTDETINSGLLGYDGFRFTIPIFGADGSLRTIRYRADYTRLPDKLLDGLREVPVPKYSGIRGRNQLYLYGAHWLQSDSKYAIICEGELDALLLHQLGYVAVSATNGAGQAYLLPSLLREACPALRIIYIATDQDRGDGRTTSKGEEAAVKVAHACREASLVACRLSWLIGKDVTEHYTRNGNRLDFMRGEWDGTRFIF